ncbi:MAG: helicase associated domain-containing protein [Adhaeribacter sp.]
MQDLENGQFPAGFLDQWEQHFAAFVALNAQSDRVVPIPSGEEREINQWAAIQRRLQHRLPAPLKNKLLAIGFDFEAREPDWEQSFDLLANFYQLHGHTILPENDLSLASLRDWLLLQIQNQQYLTEDQTRKLNSLGVDWEMISSRGLRWQRMFLKLKAYYQAYGHSRVPQKWAADPSLSNWVRVQRRVYGQNRMPENRVRLLQGLEFTWHIQAEFDQQWARFYEQLAAFHQEHGHCHVPGKCKSLVSWIERQRLARAKGLLPAEREQQLNALQFTWTFRDLKESYWQEMYQALKEFKRQQGHCLVPVNSKAHKPLGSWVATQRKLEAQGKLTKAKRQQLHRLGFVWGQQVMPRIKMHLDQQWETYYERLCCYRQAHGSCQVSLKIDPELQRWTRWQRKLFFEGQLKAGRREKLDAIHFPWCIQQAYWLKMYEALADFKRQTGHTRVPYLPGQQNLLAVWVYRHRKNKNRLTVQQRDLLQALGFDWQLRKKNVASWSEMVSRLLAFKQEFGHTRVPVMWPRDPKLGKWVCRMRLEQDKLAAGRRDQLETLGFDWSRRRRPVEEKA